MKIAKLYQMLCRLYEIRYPINIEDYLIETESLGVSASVGNAVSGRESLLIRQNGDDLELGLFINPSIIAILESSDPLDNLDALSCAIEGVSHFLYVIDRAQKNRKVSKLELELQGEVDKFLLIHLIAAKYSKSISPSLFEEQFENHHFDEELAEDDLCRYSTASYFAAKYCAFLRANYFNPLRFYGLSSQARDFFERDFPAKIARLIP